MAIKVKIRNRLQPVGGQVADPGFARRQWGPLGALGEGITDLGQSIAKISRGIESSKKALVVDQAEVAAIKAAQDAESKAPSESIKSGKTLLESYDSLVGDIKNSYISGISEYADYADAAFEKKILDGRGRLVTKDQAKGLQEVQDKMKDLYQSTSMNITSNPKMLDEYYSKIETSLIPHIYSGVITQDGANKLQKEIEKDFVEAAIIGEAEKGDREAALKIAKHYSNTVDKERSDDIIAKTYSSYLNRNIQELSLKEKNERDRYNENFIESSHNLIKKLSTSKNEVERSRALEEIRQEFAADNISFPQFVKLLDEGDKEAQSLDWKTSVDFHKRWVRGSTTEDLVSFVDQQLTSGLLTPKRADQLIQQAKSADGSRNKYSKDDFRAAEAYLDSIIGKEETLYNLGLTDEAQQKRVLLAAFREKLLDNAKSFDRAIDLYKYTADEVLSESDLKFFIPKLPREFQQSFESLDIGEAVNWVQRNRGSANLSEEEANRILNSLVLRRRIQEAKDTKKDHAERLKDTFEAGKIKQSIDKQNFTPRFQ